MLIIDPAYAALAIGGKCGGESVSSNDAGLISIITLLTPRVEDALNVASLTRGTFADEFILPTFGAGMNRFDTGSQRGAVLRLSNGFLVADSVSVADASNPSNIYTQDIHVNEELGTVEIGCWSRGRVKVTYTSGFEPSTPEGDDQPILQGIPDWMDGITIDLLVKWFRTQRLSPTGIPKTISYAALDSALQKDLYSRIYGRYMRPRATMYWSERCTTVVSP